MFSHFIDPSSMSAAELELISQNQLVTALAIFLLLMFFRAAEKHATSRQTERSVPGSRLAKPSKEQEQDRVLRG